MLIANHVPAKLIEMLTLRPSQLSSKSTSLLCCLASDRRSCMGKGHRTAMSRIAQPSEEARETRTTGEPCL